MCQIILYCALIRGTLANPQVRHLWRGRAIAALDIFGAQTWIVPSAGAWFAAIYIAKIPGAFRLTLWLAHLTGFPQ